MIMPFEIRREISTMGSVEIPKDSRGIATLKDGKKITADVAAMSPGGFRAYFERLLERDLTDESRERILMALKTPKTEDELFLEKGA